MKPIHIFKTGTHTDMHGTVMSFSERDLATAVSAYDPKKHQAPLVVGHPKTDTPAFGWVNALTAKDGNLYATPEQVNLAFSEQVQAGAYKKVSACFYPPNSPHNPVKGTYYLRHVGFLGAEPPAIKGLDPVEFSEGIDDTVNVEFELSFSEQAESTPTTDSKLMNALKVIGSYFFGEGEAHSDDVGVDTPTQTTAKPITKTPSNSPQSYKQAGGGQKAEGELETTQSTTEQDTTMTPEQIKALQEENEKLKKEKADAEAKQAQAEAEALQQANAEFAEGLVNDNKIAPKDKELVSALLDGLDRADSVKPLEFGEGRNKTSLKQALKDKFSNANTEAFAYLFSESAGKPKHEHKNSDYAFAENADPDSVTADSEVRAYMQKHDVDYVVAAKAVLG